MQRTNVGGSSSNRPWGSPGRGGRRGRKWSAGGKTRVFPGGGGSVADGEDVLETRVGTVGRQCPSCH